jgi:hypothetical protein
MLEEATVTLKYKEFQQIKAKADKYDEVMKKQKEDRQGKMIDKVLAFLEEGIESKPKNKQWYLVQALKTFYDEWEIDMDKEFHDIDKGIAP